MMRYRHRLMAEQAFDDNEHPLIPSVFPFGKNFVSCLSFPEEKFVMKLRSTSFEEGEEIPERHGYMGENVNPELVIEEVPEEAEALALVFKDPDAQKMAGKTWIHWTMWNIPTDTEKIEEGEAPGLEGTTDFRKTGYNGPNPPDGPHDVAFHLYALEEKLDIEDEASYEDFKQATENKVVEEAVLEAVFP